MMQDTAAHIIDRGITMEKFMVEALRFEKV